jgi:hypothetical protein
MAQRELNDALSGFVSTNSHTLLYKSAGIRIGGLNVLPCKVDGNVSVCCKIA